MASTGQAGIQSVQPMQAASSIEAITIGLIALAAMRYSTAMERVIPPTEYRPAPDVADLLRHEQLRLVYVAGELKIIEALAGRRRS
jgi:hypothetical protein